MTQFNSAYTIMVDFYAFTRSTLVHAGEWRRWETRIRKVGYRFVFFWIKGPPNGGCVFNNGVVYFNRIALLFFVYFSLSSILPFLRGENKGEGVFIGLRPH